MILRLDSVLVLLAGAVLGPRLGAISMVVYFVLALGLGPLAGKFAPGIVPSAFGLGYLASAQASNILAFPAAAYVVGSITRIGRGYQRVFLSMLLGLGILYWFQAVWFTYMSTGTLVQSAVLWVAPFLFFDTLKIALASLFAPALAGLVDGFLGRAPSVAPEAQVSEEQRAIPEPEADRPSAQLALEAVPSRSSAELGPASET